MNFFKNKLDSLRAGYHISISLVFFVATAVLLLSIFDSIMSYLVPVIMTEYGLSEFNMGLLYASSSFFGLVFDFLLTRYLSTTHYKKLFVGTILVAAAFPVCMFFAPGLLPFLIGMMLWGLYYNLWAFASADFTARESKVVFHVASVSLLLFFHDIGFVLGTLSAEHLFEHLSYKQLGLLLIGIVSTGFLVLLPAIRAKRKERTDESGSIFCNPTT